MGAVSIDHRAPGGALGAGSKLGRYEVLAKLAAGGMAVVYVARASGVAGFERLVAVKVLHANLAHEEEFIKMFLDEARLAARIRHPNVVPTIDISDSEESGYFIVMDYIEGDHLGQILASAHKENAKLPLPVTLRVIVDALGGLGAAHDLVDEAGKHLHLVHRDVSPHNIMVGRDGVARLTDFGVAKAEDRLTHTRDGQVKGKLAYMAPEQAASGQTDSRSDLFSMGVILWECVTGRRLFRADSTAATLHRLLHDEVPKPSTVDPTLEPLDAVLMKSLAREPADRYQSAEQFAQAVEEVASTVGGLASLRGVSKAVKQFAAAKLKRDKKLIDDAIRSLRVTDADSAGFSSDSLSEPSNPSASNISVASGSLSTPRASGVFSHATRPGVRARRRDAEGRPQGGPIVMPPPAPLAVPPPLGFLPSTMPEPLSGDDLSFDGKSPPTAARRKLQIAVLVFGVVAVAVGFWLNQKSARETVRVRQIKARQAVSAAQVAPPAAPRPAEPVAAPSPSAVRTAPTGAQAADPSAAPTAASQKPAALQVATPVVRKPRRDQPAPTKRAEAPKPAPSPRRTDGLPDFLPNPYQN